MKKEHILVIRFSAMGDVAMTVPVIQSLAEQYPDLRITMLSQKFARPFFEHMPHNVSFMEADLKNEYHGVKGLNALYRRLMAKNFTAIADLHSVLRSRYLRMRFNIDRFKVAHIDKHRNLRHQLTAQTGKRLEQLPTSFQNYADVFAALGKEENRIMQEWASRNDRLENASAQLGGIRDELVLMSHLDVMVSMDSSNMHLASLVDTPVVSVWGATHPFTGFMGWGQDPDNAVMVDMPCRPPIIELRIKKRSSAAGGKVN